MIPGLNNQIPIESVRIAIGQYGNKKSSGGHLLPEKVDYFLFTTSQKKDGKMLQHIELTAHFGNKPKKIPIMLLSDDIETNLVTMFAKYKGNGQIQIRSDDGITWTTTSLDGTRTIETCDDLDNKFMKDKNIKPRIILTGVVDAGDIGEKLFKFRTTSWYIGKALVAEMTRIKAACGGHLAYLPLNLIVFPKTVTSKDGKKLIQVVSLEPRTTTADLRMYAAENAKALHQISTQDDTIQREAARIADVEEETLDERIDVAHEFYPDIENGASVALDQRDAEEDANVAKAEVDRVGDGKKASSKKTPQKKSEKTDQKQTKSDVKKKPEPKVAKDATTEPDSPAIHKLPKGKELLPVTFPDALDEYPISADFAINVIKFDDTHYDVNGSGVWTDMTGGFYSNAKGFATPPKCVHVAVVDAILRFGVDEVRKVYENVEVHK